MSWNTSSVTTQNLRDKKRSTRPLRLLMSIWARMTPLLKLGVVLIVAEFVLQLDIKVHQALFACVIIVAWCNPELTSAVMNAMITSLVRHPTINAFTTSTNAFLSYYCKRAVFRTHSLFSSHANSATGATVSLTRTQLDRYSDL